MSPTGIAVPMGVGTSHGMACCVPFGTPVNHYLVDGQHIVECFCGATWNHTEESFHTRADTALDRVMKHAKAFAEAFNAL